MSMKYKDELDTSSRDPADQDRFVEHFGSALATKFKRGYATRYKEGMRQEAAEREACQ